MVKTVKTAERPKGARATERLDVMMVNLGLAESRERAQGLIMAGAVRVAGAASSRPSQRVSFESGIEVIGPEHPFVGRGGVKLVAALEAFNVSAQGKIALDVGASTGGFTDCLLQRGAAKVYAVDVGYGQLAWRLRQDSRVVIIERCNARFLDRSQIPEAIQLATVDVSFISLRLVLPAVARCLSADGQVIALLKPQFEVGKGKVGKGGIVRDEALRCEVVADVRSALEAAGWSWESDMPSPITGQKGNIE